jgi:hypothetical protein
MRHLYLGCQKCHRTGVALPPLQSPLEQSIEVQQQQIIDLQQQVEELRKARKSFGKEVQTAYLKAVHSVQIMWLK